MSCERLRSLWDTYIDGELPSRQMLELQTHLDGCSECSESVAFSLAIRRSMRQVTYDDAIVTDAFRERLRGALLDEARDESSRQKVARIRRLLANAPRMGLGALAAAAALLLWLTLDGEKPGVAPAIAERNPTSTAALGPQELLDLFIDYHTAPPAPAVTEARLVPELERDVGVKVPLPSLVAYGAEWQGGSLVRVPRTQPAAYLRYRTRDAHSVTVYVYNASRIPLHASLKPRMFREEPMYERNWRGYSVAAQLSHGVGYAVATDLDEARSAELVRAITKSVVSH
ncbi:MAG TPA: zf-HC2 domain-containing protein [Polyangiaceae bacterium]|nr:zf-HC2 domain-containing protein [Polyangiaceae bacterium]